MKKFSGQLLRKRREQRQKKIGKKYSQVALAVDLSVNRKRSVAAQTICEWERGGSIPGGDYLAGLSEVLECSIDDFFCN